ncbi:B-box zinc finger protein 21-like [Abrus precatorius]|uniref:B-box zinc finger protein 21-like n=1 Tax=Abrus precatorius TaxID=3816 RepID=A0A8B8LLS2_ABRPR|nr:B-box zinc finger protein 21-like [Abrus precatorius]
MKIHCDACNKHHASIFCTADEAALCDACDHRVHHANKLASKHQRFSLTQPSAKHHSTCDVCQERRAFVFCQQDRAILCKECDFSIHSANDLTKNHNRFLFTGIRLSATCTLYSSTPSTSSSNSKKNLVLDSHPPLMTKASNSPSTVPTPVTMNTNEEAGFTSSISEYLINTIPGWKFEDFLDSPSVPFASSKNGDEMLSLLDGDIDKGNLVSFSAGGIWVPQAPFSIQMDGQNGYRETREGSNRSRSGDDNFIVPQLSPPIMNASKRPRLLW